MTKLLRNVMNTIHHEKMNTPLMVPSVTGSISGDEVTILFYQKLTRVKVVSERVC
jgi:hypothetical protein